MSLSHEKLLAIIAIAPTLKILAKCMLQVLRHHYPAK